MNPWRQKMPLEWQRYVNNEVKVVADEKRQHRGWVYTVDPVSARYIFNKLMSPQFISCS